VLTIEKRLRPGALPQTPRLAAGFFFLSFSPREGEEEEEEGVAREKREKERRWDRREGKREEKK